MRRFVAPAVAFICAIAGSAVAGAPAGAASPLSWSAPVLVDNQAPFASTTEVRGVSCTGPSLCVAVGPSGKVVTSTDPTDGAKANWTVAGVDHQNNMQAVSCIDSPSLCVAVDDAGNVVVSTDPEDGPSATWTVIKVDSAFNNATRANAAFTSVSCVSVSLLCVAVDDNGDVVTSTDPDQGASATWTLSDIDTLSATNPLTGVSCVTSSFCIAVDGHGNVLGSATAGNGNSATWLSSNVDGSNAFKGVSCASAALCVAVDNAGNAVTSTTGLSWSSANIDGTNQMRAVSCVSGDTDLCVAVDIKGNALTSINPGDGASATWATKSLEKPTLFGFPFPQAVSCPTTEFCTVGDIGGKVFASTDPSDAATAVWASKAINGTNTIDAMSCPSTSLCVAVDNSGNTLTSSDPGDGAGATWDLKLGVDLKTRLTSVSCPSTALCVAVDNKGDVLTSTDPGDGASAVWTTLNLGTTKIIDGISCPSASLCVAVDDLGNAFTSSDPADGAAATWSIQNIDGSNTINAVSCAASLCVAVDNQGTLFSTTDPADGATASATWVANAADAGNNVLAVACPSSVLCVAVDNQGNALTSTDPGDDASATWIAADVDAANTTNSLNAISCPSSSLCMVVDGHGNAVSSSDPADGATANWTTTQVDDDSSMTAVSCPTTTLCAAGDQPGNTLAGVGHILTVSVAGTGTGTVTSGDESISCPGTCSGQRGAGTTVTLTAVAGENSQFTGWSGGGCSGTGQCIVTMSDDQNVTATFLAPVKLSVTTVGSGTVSSDDGTINCPGSCSNFYAPGATVNLTANPAPGFSFAGWSGVACSAALCSVLMGSAQNVTAMFTANSPPPPDNNPPPPPGNPRPGSGPGSNTVTPPSPSSKPTCTLRPKSDRVSARERIEKRRNGKRTTIPPKRTLALTVRCDQAAQLKLGVVVTSVSGAKHGKRRVVRTFHLGALRARTRAGVSLTLTVKLPRAALATGARDTVALTLRAVNANGASTTTAKIARLILV